MVVHCALFVVCWFVLFDIHYLVYELMFLMFDFVRCYLLVACWMCVVFFGLLIVARGSLFVGCGLFGVVCCVLLVV